MLSGAAKRKQGGMKRKRENTSSGLYASFCPDLTFQKPQTSQLQLATPAGYSATLPYLNVVATEGGNLNPTLQALAVEQWLSATAQGEVLEDKVSSIESRPEQCYQNISVTELIDSDTVMTSYPSDPAKWNKVDNEMRNYFAANKPCQNIGDFSASLRKYGGTNRSFTKKSFFRKKQNGEIAWREWLVYSPSTGSVYCYCCKLFSTRITSFVAGFNDWKNASIRLREHENSMEHRSSMLSISLLRNNSSQVNSNLVQRVESERAYWSNILKRIVATIQFLSSRGLPFLGPNEQLEPLHNGNFMGCLELISRFDPLLSGHLAKYGTKSNGDADYLSLICDDIVQLMADKVHRAIAADVKDSKYFSIIVNSTPDIAHAGQLALITRYVQKSSGEPVERFLGFLPLHGRSAAQVATMLKSTLKDIGIDLTNCRGQSYDNACNTATLYSELQSGIGKENPCANIIPCSAHYLNLVCACAAECCTEAVSYFGFIHTLYGFFSASTLRWEILTSYLAKCGRSLTLKNLSATRWCARADAATALRFGYKVIQDALNEIKVDHGCPRATQHEACQLIQAMSTFETALMAVVWGDLLEKIHSTSKALQQLQMDICTVPTLYDSLIEFISKARDDFDLYEAEAKHLTTSDGYKVDNQRSGVKKEMLDDYSASLQEQRSGHDAFFVLTHCVICDHLSEELKQRKNAYENLEAKFGFLTKAKSLNVSDMRAATECLKAAYPKDLEEEFSSEFCQFISIMKNEQSVASLYKQLRELGLKDVFINVDVCLRLYLTLPISNCPGEMSCSLLRRVDAFLKSAAKDKNLNALALLAIENRFTTSLNFDDVIEDFTSSKIALEETNVTATEREKIDTQYLPCFLGASNRNSDVDWWSGEISSDPSERQLMSL